MKRRRLGNPEGVRPYGPGKFDTIIDGYLYNLSLSNGTDKDLNEEGFGYVGLMYGPLLKDLAELARSEGDKLTQAETRFIIGHNVGAVLWENDQGFVSVRWFKDKDELDDYWEDVEAEFEEFLNENPPTSDPRIGRLVENYLTKHPNADVDTIADNVLDEIEEEDGQPPSRKTVLAVYGMIGEKWHLAKPSRRR